MEGLRRVDCGWVGRGFTDVLGSEPTNNVQVKPHKYCLIDVCSTFYCIYGVFNERASALVGRQRRMGRCGAL